MSTEHPIQFIRDEILEAMQRHQKDINGNPPSNYIEKARTSIDLAAENIIEHFRISGTESQIASEVYRFLYYWHKDVLGELERFLESDVSVEDFV